MKTRLGELRWEMCDAGYVLCWSSLCMNMFLMEFAVNIPMHTYSDTQLNTFWQYTLVFPVGLPLRLILCVTPSGPVSNHGVCWWLHRWVFASHKWRCSQNIIFISTIHYVYNNLKYLSPFHMQFVRGQCSPTFPFLNNFFYLEHTMGILLSGNKSYIINFYCQEIVRLIFRTDNSHERAELIEHCLSSVEW